jgi:hypothetical protein
LKPEGAVTWGSTRSHMCSSGKRPDSASSAFIFTLRKVRVRDDISPTYCAARLQTSIRSSLISSATSTFTYRRPRPQSLHDPTSAKLSVIFNLIFLQLCFSSIVSDSPVSVTLADLLYMFFSCFFPSPRHSRRLGVADLHARGLGFVNIKVVRPEGLN